MFRLSKLETEEQSMSQTSKSNLPVRRNLPKSMFLFFLTIGISVLFSLFVFYDPNSAEAEKILQDLDIAYKIGKKLTDKEFEQYCFLMRKIRKTKLADCVCKEGIDNSTPGIDWLNPPKSPDFLDSDWVEITHPRARQFSNTRKFIHKKTKEMISFDKGIEGETGEREYNHWHRFNPNTTGDHDLYLNLCGKPTAKKKPDSHIGTNDD